MANILAAATGNWSSTATWVGGVLPSSADTVMSNGFTVTINQDITVVELRADGTGGASSGGGFSVAAATGTTRAINAKLTSCNLTATLTGGTINITGDVTSTAVAAWSIGSSSTTGTLNFFGNLTNSGAEHATPSLFVGTISVTGNVSHSGSAHFFGLRYGCTLTITGNVSSSSSGGSAVLVASTNASTVTITGSVSATGTFQAIWMNGAGTLYLTGTATGGASSAAPAVTVAQGTSYITRAVGGTVAAGVVQSSSGVSYVEEIEYGSTGASPTSGLHRLTDKTNNKCLFFRQGLSKKTVSDIAGLGVLPAVADVRLGVNFNAGQLSGTCAVPSAGSVALGVAVDATTGTAILTSAQIQTACASALSAFSGGRLADCATTATVGQQIADATF